MIRIQITGGRGEFADLNPDVDFIQVREPELTTRQLERVVGELVALGRPRILVNDRADIAIACGAAGIHLRGNSVSPRIIRRIAPPGFIVTVACHSVEDVRNANGADYVLLAPIFAPISKPDTRTPLGVEAIRECERFGIPIVALGGITENNIPACLDAGAAGVAGISVFRSIHFNSTRPTSREE